MNNRYVLVSSFYDGKLKKVGLKFYDTLSDQIHVVFDNTGFMPYFISSTPRQELEKLRSANPSIVKLAPISLVDPLTDKVMDVTKVVVNDPLAISGSEAKGKVGLRDVVDAHEADIRTYLNFLYDTNTIPGTYFDGDNGKLVPSTFKTSEGADKLLAKVIATPDMTDEAKQVFTEWVSLFDQPIPTFKVLALDIETWNERAYKVPNPETAVMPIIAVSLVGDGGVKEVHVYTKGRHPNLKRDFGIVYHATEKSLLTAVIKRVEEYPFLITFNGDAFDLTYIRNRAKALGVRTPFKVKPGKKPKDVEVSMKVGIHIDLYKFHSNKSVANYVFEGRYHEFTLDAISMALLGEGKVEIPTKGDMAALTYDQLVDYSIQDSILTHKLASRQSQLALKMIVLFSRTSMMPMDDISRHGISTWIKSMLYYQMKKRNLLIPNRKDLESKGGASTTAIIKGKQYQGAIVVDPVPGVYFDVKVLDFASLYPTSIRNWNLSFDTVNCQHEECKSNIIPGTQHWSCKKKVGVISLMIGALRDLRISLYKPLSKSKDVSDDERDTANTIAQSLKVYLNACFTGDTYVITPTGVKNIKEMKAGDEVLNVNPESLRVERDRVVEVQRFAYHGPLYHFKNKRFLDLMVTPNHRMLVADPKSDGSTALFLTAEEVYNTASMSIPRVRGAVGLINSGFISRSSIKLTHDAAEHHKYVSKVPHDGPVYCVTTQRNHTVIAGRNGRFVPVGQSYGVTGFSGFGLFCVPVAESTAAVGRYAITSVQEKCKDLGIKTIGGDSVLSGTPTLVRCGNSITIRKIDDVVPGNLVLDENGWTEVRRAIRKKVDKTIYRVETHVGAVEVTKDHSLVDVYGNEVKPSQVQVGDILGMTKYTFDDLNIVHLDGEVSWLLGYFVADGTAKSYRYNEREWKYAKCQEKSRWKTRSDTKNCVHFDSQDRSLLVKAQRALGSIGFDSYIRSYQSNITSGGMVYRLNIRQARDAVAYFSKCYNADGSKKVPDDVLNSDLGACKQFIAGYMAGDGSNNESDLRHGLKATDVASVMFGIHVLARKCGITTRYTCYIGQRKRRMYLREVKFIKNPTNMTIKPDEAIRSITNLGKQHCVVYDLETVSHHFSAGGVLLHNTDSVFLLSPANDQLDSLTKWAKEVLHLDLEVDKAYRLALLSARKKNYLGVLLDGKPVIKGLTGKKSNNPPYIREAFMEAVNDIVNIKNVNDVEPTKKKLMELATERYRKLSAHEIQAKELAVHMKMTAPIDSYAKSTPQHVQAAKFLVEAGRDVQEGDTITFVKIKPQKLKVDDDAGGPLLDRELTKEEKKARDAKISAKPLEFVENEEIDYDKYKGMFISTFAQIFDPLGLNLDDESLSPLKKETHNTSLDAFWN